MKRDFDLYESEDGKGYAVLVSQGYGDGWSDGDPQLACDKRIVEFWLSHKDDKEFMKELDKWDFINNHNNKVRKECDDFFHSIGFEDSPSMSGFYQIHLEWVEYGDAWCIDSYDGWETIEYYIPSNYIMFFKGEKHAED